MKGKGSIRMKRWLGIASSACIGLGLLLTGVFVIAQVDQRTASAAAIEEFERARAGALSTSPDQTLWSPGRRQHFADSAASDLDALGVMSMPTIDLTVPIFEGTEELVLNRGIGRIEGTAALDSHGNIGLAGHRDGFFRGLKDIAIDDPIDVTTLTGTRTYRVSELLIVEPEDVYVLAPTAEPAVTLVTCYPFYFVGHAPQRFIVRAVAEESPASPNAAIHQ
jgi:sortase A